MRLRIHSIYYIHMCTSEVCAGAWNGEWHGIRRGDNARTITMMERATHDSVQRAADTGVCFVLYVFSFENCAATWFAPLRDSRFASLSSLYGS